MSDGRETLRLSLALDDWRQRADFLEHCAEEIEDEAPEMAAIYERLAFAYSELHDAGRDLLVYLASDAGADS